MVAARRRQYVAEDADDVAECFVPYLADPEPSDTDALDHAVAPEDLWPAFWCDFCDTRNEPSRWTCCMCGTVRPDADVLS